MNNMPWPGASPCLGDASEYRRWHELPFFNYIDCPAYDINGVRKWWEWQKIAEWAEESGLLNDKSSLLGLGCGSEPLVYYFAGRAGHVLASDIYSAETSWGEARFRDLEQLYGKPYTYPRERLDFENADMRQVPVADESIDLVWSCSSIEHVPSLFDTWLVYAEIARVLKPGGLAILTTEYCVDGPSYLLRSLNALDSMLLPNLVGSLGGLSLLGSVSVPEIAAGQQNRPFLRRYVGARPISSGIQEASSSMYQKIGFSTLAPVAYVLRKAGRTITPWRSLALPEQYYLYSDAVLQAELGNSANAARMLEGCYEDALRNCPLQLAAQIAFVYLSALAQGASRGAYLSKASKFIQILPEDGLLDADIVAAVAMQMGAVGEVEECAKLLQRCAMSPSALFDHSIAVSCLNIKALNLLGRAEEGISGLVDNLRDLLANGLPIESLRRVLTKEIPSLTPDETQQQQLLKLLCARAGC